MKTIKVQDIDIKEATLFKKDTGAFGLIVSYTAIDDKGAEVFSKRTEVTLDVQLSTKVEDFLTTLITKVAI